MSAVTLISLATLPFTLINICCVIVSACYWSLSCSPSLRERERETFLFISKSVEHDRSLIFNVFPSRRFLKMKIKFVLTSLS